MRCGRHGHGTALNKPRIETGTAVVAFVAARGTQSIDPSLLAAAGNRGVAFADQTTRPGGLPKENAPNLLQAGRAQTCLWLERRTQAQPNDPPT